MLFFFLRIPRIKSFLSEKAVSFQVGVTQSLLHAGFTANWETAEPLASLFLLILFSLRN